MKKLPPNLVKRGDVYVYRVKVNGKTRRINLHTRNFNEAMVKYREIMLNGHESFEDEDVTPGAAVATITWEQMRDWDMARAGLQSRPEVVESGVGYSWKRLRYLFPDAHAVSNDSLATYARKQLDAGLSSSTIKRDLYAIMRGYRWARKQLGTLPVVEKDIKMKKTPKRVAKGEFIDSETLEAIVCELRPLAAQKLMLVLTTGIRYEEWRRLQRSWFSSKKVGEDPAGFIDMPEGSTKNGDARRIPLSSTLFTNLLSFPDFTVNYRKAWNTAAKRVGLTRLSQRDLRHTFATMMAPIDKYGVDLVMGHDDPNDAVGKLYQHATDERLAELARATLRVWPWLLPRAIEARDLQLGLI